MYAEDEDVQVLSLPYLDMSYAFNIILPKQRYYSTRLANNKKAICIIISLSILTKEMTLYKEVSP